MEEFALKVSYEVIFFQESVFLTEIILNHRNKKNYVKRRPVPKIKEFLTRRGEVNFSAVFLHFALLARNLSCNIFF